VPGKRYGLAQRSSPISPVAVVADTITKLVRFQSQPVSQRLRAEPPCTGALSAWGFYSRRGAGENGPRSLNRLERRPLGFGRLTALGVAAPSRWISSADRPQSSLTETLDIALTGLCKRDDALRKRRTDGVVMVGGSTERGCPLDGSFRRRTYDPLGTPLIDMKSGSDCVQVP
jgi:hypothetical protein